jgi:hypothetical protein
LNFFGKTGESCVKGGFVEGFEVGNGFVHECLSALASLQRLCGWKKRAAARTTAGPSTPPFAKSANGFAQDDSSLLCSVSFLIFVLENEMALSATGVDWDAQGLCRGRLVTVVVLFLAS